MEQRKITVIETNTQSKKVIMSAATTLGELKVDFDNNNIDYTNQAFYEGVSKTELKTDESILPTNVPYKGTTTNELVFMLTTVNNKIASGLSEDRLTIYERIKNNQNLKDAIKSYFGLNYTNVATNNLIAFITEFENKDNKKQECQCHKYEPNAVIKLAELLCVKGIITAQEFNQIISAKEDIIASPYSDKELDEMFSNML